MNVKQLKPETLAALRAGNAKLRSMAKEPSPQVSAIIAQKSRPSGRAIRSLARSGPRR